MIIWRDPVKGVKNGETYLGRLADLGVKRTAADLDSLRSELEKIFEREFSGDTAKTATRGFGVGDSQPGKQSVSAYGASPATDATRTAATGADAWGVPFTDAKLAGAGSSNAGQVAAEPPSAAGSGDPVSVGQNQAAQRVAKALAKLIVRLEALN